MDSPPEATVQERGEAEVGTRELLALLARQRIELPENQLDRVIAALERLGGFADLRKLTKEQQDVVDGFRRTAEAIGIRGLKVSPPRVVRCGRVVALKTTPPPGTVRARIFLESGVETVEVDCATKRLWLPEHICDHDRIARVEFLDAKGALLGVTGGEVSEAKKESGQCSTY